VELLRPDEFASEPGDLVHRETLFGRVAVVAVFALIGAGWTSLPLFVRPWGFLGWLPGLVCLGIAALAWPGVRRGFGREHWAVRLRPGGIALRLRSYLNDDLPAEDPVVCWIPGAEIRALRRGRTERIVPGDDHDRHLTEHYLDIELTHASTAELAAALARERAACRRGRAHHHVYPVRLAAPDVVRVTWRDPHLALRPGLGRALEFLARHQRLAEPSESSLNWRELSDAQVDDLVLELCTMGSRMEAVELLRVRRGWDLTRARSFVEELAA
jgi:hypothetical protein